MASDSALAQDQYTVAFYHWYYTPHWRWLKRWQRKQEWELWLKAMNDIIRKEYEGG